MPSLAERRAQAAAQGNSSANGDFIRFKTENETKILRFLFTDASAVESHKKWWDPDQKKWLIDEACPEGKGSYKITFNCVEYDKGGVNPRRVRFEISEYLYNEYLAPYVEKEAPASKNVFEIKVRRPGTMDVSYVAFKIDGATEANYPIPQADTTNNSGSTNSGAATPGYTTPAQQAPAQQSAPAEAPAQTTPTTTPDAAPATPKRSKYF